MSSAYSLSSPDFSAPMLETMSISSAPSSMALLASATFTSVVPFPWGKLTTADTLTPLPCSLWAARLTWVGLTQTLQNP